MKRVWTTIKWIVYPNGTYEKWKKEKDKYGGLWTHYCTTKKWWIFRKHYINGSAKGDWN